MIGQDRKSQLAALQAWLRAHEQDISDESVQLIQGLLTSWQLARSSPAGGCNSRNGARHRAA
eukprot:1982456-Amphidinium_carterae.1